MRQLFTRYPNKTRRLLEIVVPGMTWLLITMPFWLSFWHPAIVAYLIITFDVYWFYKSFRLAIHAIRSFLMISAHTKVDWVTLTNLAQQDFPKERIIVVLATEDKDPHARETEKTLRKKFGSLFGKFMVTRHVLHTGEVAGKSSNMAWAAK